MSTRYFCVHCQKQYKDSNGYKLHFRTRHGTTEAALITAKAQGTGRAEWDEKFKEEFLVQVKRTERPQLVSKVYQDMI